MEVKRTIVRVGSRKSVLAMTQTRKVVGLLEKKHPHVDFEIISIDTLGDKILHLALPKIGEKSLFTKDLEVLLEKGMVDFVVHSLKDLPSELPEGMTIGAVCERDDPYDCVLFHPRHVAKTLSDLSAGSIIGTSSVRRVAQLKRRYPNLEFQSIRGNLNTRLQKLHEGGVYEAIILAQAGVDRLGWQDKVGQKLTPPDCYYAIGQGALGVECRNNDAPTQALLATINHRPTQLRCMAERRLMYLLGGGCSAPLACETIYDEEMESMEMTGVALSVDGQKIVVGMATKKVEQGENGEAQALKVARKVAEIMQEKGADAILEEAHSITHSKNINAKPQ